ncbi:MAG TPA: acyl-CoA dehydrogenase family protein, partial [Gemmatimonadales bacterium]|nr:acyl-CoA dehydrogenase family protein [Gemmatimonadales bacterium]
MPRKIAPKPPIALILRPARRPSGSPPPHSDHGHMDLSLYLSEQHYQVRDMVREFARQEVAPVARELDRTSAFPWENIRKMGELGLL